jgi:large-conductance mechanosensitive channel
MDGEGNRFNWWIVLAVLVAFLLIGAAAVLMVTDEAEDREDREDRDDGDDEDDEDPEEEDDEDVLPEMESAVPATARV